MENENANIILTDRANEEFNQNSLLKYLSINRFLSNQKIIRGHLFGESVTSSHIIDCQLKNVSIINSTFINCNFNNVSFEASELKSIKFVNCSFTSVSFLNNMIDNLLFENSFFDRCDLDFKAPGIETSNVYIQLEKTLNDQKNDQKITVNADTTKVKDQQSNPLAKRSSGEPLGRFGHLDLEEK